MSYERYTIWQHPAAKSQGIDNQETGIMQPAVVHLIINFPMSGKWSGYKLFLLF